MYAASPTPTADPSGAVAGFADATGGYLPLVCTLNATKVTDTVAGWLGMDHETFAAAALMRLPALMVSGSPLFRRRADTQPARCNGHVEGLRNDTTSRIWPELPMKGCFAACSSDVRPWPPQEQRSMGECT